jgi:hypothetical protein
LHHALDQELEDTRASREQRVAQYKDKGIGKDIALAVHQLFIGNKVQVDRIENCRKTFCMCSVAAEVMHPHMQCVLACCKCAALTETGSASVDIEAVGC